MKKILTVVGARPQFIKASVVSKAIKEDGKFEEIIVHTGQHFDANMSDVFFNQLDIPKPSICLDIHGGTHGKMTGRMLVELEKVIMEEKPDRVMVYGDTNSTLAGALAAVKLHIPVAHVEAGLRSFNMAMPEEINRILTDQVSDVLFCPTRTAMDNLKKEGFEDKPVHLFQVGDVMQDSAMLFRSIATRPNSINTENTFILATVHRAENTDDHKRLSSIVSALNTLHKTVAPVVLPLHPRTRNIVQQLGLSLQVQMIEPVGYLEMLWLLEHCGLVLTDSGGVQKEAFFFGKYCITLRDETEWAELVDAKVNILTGVDNTKIDEMAGKYFSRLVQNDHMLYGGGKAARKILEHLCKIDY